MLINIKEINVIKFDIGIMCEGTLSTKVKSTKKFSIQKVP